MDWQTENALHEIIIKHYKFGEDGQSFSFIYKSQEEKLTLKKIMPTNFQTIKWELDMASSTQKLNTTQNDTLIKSLNHFLLRRDLLKGYTRLQ